MEVNLDRAQLALAICLSTALAACASEASRFDDMSQSCPRPQPTASAHLRQVDCLEQALNSVGAFSDKDIKVAGLKRERLVWEAALEGKLTYSQADAAAAQVQSEGVSASLNRTATQQQIDAAATAEYESMMNTINSSINTDYSAPASTTASAAVAAPPPVAAVAPPVVPPVPSTPNVYIQNSSRGWKQVLPQAGSSPGSPTVITLPQPSSGSGRTSSSGSGPAPAPGKKK